MSSNPEEQDQKRYEQVLEKATKDQAYRQRLKAEPISVLKEAGIDIPEGVEVRVREFDHNCRYLFLPPPNYVSGQQMDLASKEKGG
jgi:hypothetical protein